MSVGESRAASTRRAPVDGYRPSGEIDAAVRHVHEAVRRYGGSRAVLGPKASRTRQRLLDVGLELFDDRGYLNTTTAMVAEVAGVSEATFYQYFPDLKGLVLALAENNVVEMLRSNADVWEPTTGRIGLRRMLAAFVRLYFEHLTFFRLWEQVVQIDERVAMLQRDFWSGHKRRFEKTLRRGAELGVVRDDVAPSELARAMTLMTAKYCNDVAIFDPPTEPISEDEVVDTLTSIWADAIGLVEMSELRRSGGVARATEGVSKPPRHAPAKSRARPPREPR